MQNCNFMLSFVRKESQELMPYRAVVVVVVIQGIILSHCNPLLRFQR